MGKMFPTKQNFPKRRGGEGKIDEKHNFNFLIRDTDEDDEKAFYEMEKKKQIKTKLKYCTIILEDKELEILFSV